MIGLADDEDVYDQPSIEPSWRIGMVVRLYRDNDACETGRVRDHGKTVRGVEYVDIDFGNWIERFNKKAFTVLFENGEIFFATWSTGFVIDNFVKKLIRSRRA